MRKNPKGQTITGTVKSSSPNRVEVLVDKGVNEWVDSIFAEAMANFLGAEINKLSRIETEKKKTETTVVKQPDAGIQSNQEEGSAPKQPKPESSSSAEQKPTGPAGSEPQQGVKAANQSREWLEKMEQAARARLEARHGGSVRMLAGLPMDDLVDYSIIGMCKLANKTMDIAEFSAEMLGEFGDNLKLFIHAIYAQSKAMLDMEPAQIDEMIELAAKDKEDNTPQETPDGGEGDGRGNPDSLGIMAREHWKKYRPMMYRQLQTTGKLKKALIAAQELTKEAMIQIEEELAKKHPMIEEEKKEFLKRAGYHNWKRQTAWEMVREEWILLPSEEDEPEMKKNPAAWEIPSATEGE